MSFCLHFSPSSWTLNLSLPHSIVYVFTFLNDTDEWKIHINIHNTDLVHANNSVVNKAGEYNDAQN
jgi:hypothetical protein